MSAARPVRPVDFLAPVITPAPAPVSPAPSSDVLQGAHSTRCADCRTLFPRDGVNTRCRCCRDQLALLGDVPGEQA